MLQQGISEGKYIKTEDNILKELKSFNCLYIAISKNQRFIMT